MTIHCLSCGLEVDFSKDHYQVRKNGNKTGSKGVGYICEICFHRIEADY